MELVKPGIYNAKLVDYYIGKTNQDLPQAELWFEFEVDGTKRTMPYFGTFKEGKGREITLKALLVCGLRGNDPTILTLGKEGNGLELGKEVSITISQENDQDGKTRNRIQWVNPLGGGAFREKASKADFVAAFGDLRGDLAALRQETGMTGPKQEQGEFAKASGGPVGGDMGW